MKQGIKPMKADPLSELARVLVRRENREYLCWCIQASTLHSNTHHGWIGSLPPIEKFYC